MYAPTNDEVPVVSGETLTEVTDKISAGAGDLAISGGIVCVRRTTRLWAAAATAN